MNRYQASVEARCYGNMSETQVLWNDIMTRHGNQAGYWLEYIELERYSDDIVHHWDVTGTDTILDKNVY